MAGPELIRSNWRRELYQNLPYWAGGAGIGLAAAGYERLFRLCYETTSHLFRNHFAIWACTVPVGFWVSWYLVQRFSPGAAGSGIPQVMASLKVAEGGQAQQLPFFLGGTVSVIKFFSSLIAVLTGAAIGREGPTVQIGASMFYWMGKKLPSDAESARRWDGLILAGGAAGIAAAFNTPLGGIVFAIEELATTAFRQFRSSILLGVIVAGVVAEGIMGSYLYLGRPQLHEMGWLAIPISMLIGVIGGLLGASFGTSLFYFIGKRRSLAGRPHQWLWILAVSILFIVLTKLSDGASLGPGVDGIGLLLFEKKVAGAGDVAVRFLSTELSYLIGGAGGIFSPSLAIGAQLGSYVGTWMPTGSVDPAVVALFGMAAFLTGVTHAPLTSLVLVMEMSGGTPAIFPMMLTVLIAYWITRQIHPASFYERMKDVYLKASVP